MPRYGMVVDVTKCSACYNCFMSCKDEHFGNDYAPISESQPENGHFWMNLIQKERGQYPKVKVASIPLSCMNCEDAPCIAAAENGAVYRRDDGIVVIDTEKAKGQKQLVASCPYGVIYWNGESSLAQKCTTCAHLLDSGWKEPRCVEACPTGALVFGDLDDAESPVSRLVGEGGTETFPSLGGAKPTTRYVGLPKKFVAGTVYYADAQECAEGVTVKIAAQNSEQTSKTNFFGDFEFDGLPDGVTCDVVVQADGYQDQTFKVTTDKDVYLGKVFLTKA